MFFGIFSPIRNDIPTYMNYDIQVFRDNIRFLEVMVSREGGNNNTAPLYFDGAVNYFKELPKPDNINEMEGVYSMIRKNRAKKNETINIILNGEKRRNFRTKWGRKNNKRNNKSRWFFL